MTRKEFLSTLGLGAGFVLTATCLGSCTTEVATDVNFEVDLQDMANAALLTNGGYVIIDKVVVAKTTSGDYVAATVVCSHENKSEITLKNDEWYCTDHAARFDLSGSGLNSKGDKGLTIYSVETIDANTLRVFS
jgi:nitrite reductase/ring-hydroxylating ferredoxin subunit